MNLSAKSSVTGLCTVGGGTSVTLHAWHTPASDTTVTAAGQLMVGGVVSLTVTVWVQVLILPEASGAVHVTVVLPTGKQLGASLVILCTVQLSVTCGTPAPICIAAIASDGALPKPIATHEYCKLPFWVR